MPRVLPSEVVGIIDQMTAGAGWNLEANPNVLLEQGHLGTVATLLGLAEQVPKELLVISGEEYLGLLAAMSALRAAVGAWQVENRYRLGMLPGFGQVHVLILIRRALAACPDEFPAPETRELAFIEDTELRDGLRLDISAINRALSNSEWKATTVLAGSVVEALLLWALRRLPEAEVFAKAIKLSGGGTLDRRPGPELEKWHLQEYIEVAAALNIVDPNTAAQARLAREYRNLIHPGRALRLGTRCDRGIALGAVAALEMVVRDLERRK